jgi:hypothetical protein
MHRKAEEEAASGTNGDDDNAARRRLRPSDAAWYCGRDHWATPALQPAARPVIYADGGLTGGTEHMMLGS